jgi:3-isopropylmalate dehydrogenase
MTDRSLLILPGDGIGPEVMAEVRKVIDWFGAGHRLRRERGSGRRLRL